MVLIYLKIYQRIIPRILVICATMGAAVIAMVDALSRILFAEVRLSEMIPFFGF